MNQEEKETKQQPDEDEDEDEEKEYMTIYTAVLEIDEIDNYGCLHERHRFIQSSIIQETVVRNIIKDLCIFYHLLENSIAREIHDSHPPIDTLEELHLFIDSFDEVKKREEHKCCIEGLFYHYETSLTVKECSVSKEKIR